MKIGIKLIGLRNARGLSQEKVADFVGVSRQSVAKWESDESLPELENLVTLSKFFGVSIDSMVKDLSDCQSGPHARQNQGSDGVIEFLCRAKKATYAGHGPKLPSSRIGSHDLRHAEGDLLYYDSYLGGERFVGEEAVWKDQVPLWGMNYCGRVLGQGFSGDFLKESLSLVTSDYPYRGPRLFAKGDFTYHCAAEGSFEWFYGREEIFFGDTLVYECLFHGGLVQ